MIRGALVLAVTSALSYLAGLLRDRTLAGTFGASDALDAYQAAFIVPDFLFNLLVAGALAAAFVPVFTDLRTKRRHRQAAALAGALLLIGLLVLAAAGLAAALLADPLASLVAPGFGEAKHAQLVQLTRLLLLSPLLFFVSNLLGGMLISTKRFLFYGLSPIFYNLGIIAGAFFLAPTLGITGVVVGTLIGAGAHLALRVVDLARAGLTLQPTWAFTPAVRKVLYLMAPRVVGMTAVQVQLSAFVALASTQGEGAVTIYNLARNFQSFPVSLLGIAIATSLFPHLAESASRRDSTIFKRQLWQGIGLTAATTVPAAALMYLLRSPLVQLLVGTGAFDVTAVARTAVVLGVFTLAIPTESLTHILARAFYSLHNTIIPVAISLTGIATSIAIAARLTPTLGVSSIPAGFAVGTALQALFLALLLPWWMRRRSLSAP